MTQEPPVGRTVALKRLADIQLGKMLKPAPTNPVDAPTPYIRAGHVGWWSHRSEGLPEMYSSPQEEITYGLRRGDLLVSEGGDVGRAAIVGSIPSRTIIQNSLHRLRSIQSDLRFIGYWLEGASASGWLDIVTNKATIAHLTVDKLGNLRLPALSLDEQRRIADYLDEETARIDALIRTKQAMLHLLDERSGAVITRLSTLGVDRDARIRRGNLWFPKVPEHWEIGPLKRWWTVTDCKHYTATYVDQGIPIVGTPEVRPGRLSLAGAKHTTPEDFASLIEGGREPKLGDIIYSRNASLGSAAYVDTDQPFCMGQDVCLMSSPDQSQFYLSFLLRSHPVLSQVDSLVVGATFKRINVDQIRNFTVVHPPPEEQTRIATELDRVIFGTDQTASSIHKQIELLSEYRKAVVTAAVTGQLDEATLNRGTPADELLEMDIPA